MPEHVIQLEYKSFKGLASWDRYSRHFHGDIQGIGEFIGFESPTRVDLEGVFQQTVEGYIRSSVY